MKLLGLVAAVGLLWLISSPHPAGAAGPSSANITVSSSGTFTASFNQTGISADGTPDGVHTQKVSFTWSESGVFTANGNAVSQPQLQVSGSETETDTIYDATANNNCTGTLSAKPYSDWSSILLVNGYLAGKTVYASAAEPGGDEQPPSFIASNGNGYCATLKPYFNGANEMGYPPYLAARAGMVSFPTSQSQFSQSFPVDYSASPNANTTYSLKIIDTVTVSDCSAGGAMAHVSTAGSCGTYVALGDSFSTGQTGDAPCLRSDIGYPHVYDPQVIFKACSGATTQAIKANQVGALSKHTKVVSITAGGDDADLFGILLRCIFTGTGLAHCRYELDKSLRSPTASLTTVQRSLQSLFVLIHKKAKNAKVYALGYPVPTPQLVPRSCVAPLRIWLLGGLFGVRQADAELFWKVIQQLNHVVLAAAKASHVTYVPPFRGHTICSQDPWFGSLADFPGGQTLHPNQQGNVAMGNALRRYAGPPPS